MRRSLVTWRSLTRIMGPVYTRKRMCVYIILSLLLSCRQSGSLRADRTLVSPSGIPIKGVENASQSYLSFIDSAMVILYANFENTQTSHHMNKRDLLNAYGRGDYNAYPPYNWSYAVDGFMDRNNPFDSTNICVDDGNNKFMRSKMPKDMVELINYPTDTSGGGFQYHIKLGGQYDELYSTGLFRWNNTEADTIYNGDGQPQTGKLPFGMYAGDFEDACSGTDWSTCCDGGPCDAFSLGGAFRDRDYNTDTSIHTIAAYLYHWNQRGTYGDITMAHDLDDPGKDYIFDNQWHSLTYYVKLNNVGEQDGIIRLFIDGRKVVERTGLKLRHTAHRHIEWSKNYWFFGGSNWSQRAYRDHYFDIDEHYVFMYNSGAQEDNLLLPNWDLSENRPIINGKVLDYSY